LLSAFVFHGIIVVSLTWAEYHYSTFLFNRKEHQGLRKGDKGFANFALYFLCALCG
jgi:hypothetical protein